jgi:hypothetical protein
MLPVIDSATGARSVARSHAARRSPRLRLRCTAETGSFLCRAYGREPLMPLDELRPLLAEDAAAAAAAHHVYGSAAEALGPEPMQ